MTRAEYDRPHIPQKDFYTVQDIYSAAEVARLLGVKPIKIYHYAKDAMNPPPLKKWCNGSRGSFVIQKELIDYIRNMMTPINLVQQYNAKTRKAVKSTYHRTEFGSNPAWL